MQLLTLNQNLGTVSFDKILTWLTAGKHGFTHCRRRNRQHSSLFVFSVFCLVRGVGLTDADTEALPPPTQYRA